MNGLEIELNELTLQLNTCVKNNCSQENKSLIKKNIEYLMSLLTKIDKIKSNDDINKTYLFYKENKYQYNYNQCITKKCGKLVTKIALFIINVCKSLIKDKKNNIPSFIKRIVYKCEKIFTNPELMTLKNLQRRSFDIAFLTRYISQFNYVICREKL